MSREIDQRIVDMQFNNKQFEAGIAESISSLDKLKGGLGNLSGSALDGLQTGIDRIADKFSVLGIMGVTALQNITTSIMNAGTALIKSFSTEPISDGLAEYELKMDSVQTIMSGSGESLKTVNQELDELNTYADKTIYSFKDMTSNIGKFTNAGVKLEAAVQAIQGVSNLAAVSGANANEASRAMYNISQALSAGHVKLIDWKSIENANMATVEFKNYLLEAAVAAGTLEKTSDGMYRVFVKENKDGSSVYKTISATQGFNDALQDQWLTTDVLINTLNAYADETTDIGKKAFAAAQDVKTFTQLMDTLKEAVGSGWAQTFEILIGDFEEAKALWTGINNVVSSWLDATSDARNELLKGWDELGGRASLIDAFKNAFEGVASVIKPIKEAFVDIFPPVTAEKLFDITETLKAFTEKLTISDETADKLKRTFSGLFAAADLLIGAFSFLWDVSTGIVGIFLPMSGGVLDLTAGIGDFLTSLRDAAKAGDVFNNASEGVLNFIKLLVDDFKVGISVMSDFFSQWDIAGYLEDVSERVRDTIEKISDYFSLFSGIDLGPLRLFSGEVETQFRPFSFAADLVIAGVTGIIGAFEFAMPYFQKIADFLIPIFAKIWEAIKWGLDALGIQSFRDVFDPVIIGTIVLTLKSFFDQLSGFTEEASGFLDGVKGVLDGVRGSLEAYQQQLQSKTLINIAIAVGILAAAIFVLSTIDGQSLAVALAGITVLFAELTAAMLIMSNNIGGGKFAGIKLAAVSTQLVAISTALLIMSTACKGLAELDWDELTRGLTGISVMLLELVAFEKLLGDGKGLANIGFAMIPLATGILILSEACKNMAGLDWDELARGLTGIGVLLLELSIFSKLVDSQGMLTVGLAMIPLATGILILSHAMANLAGLSWEELAKGLIGLGGALAAVALSSKLVDPGKLLAMGAAMVGVGAGISIIAGAMVLISGLRWEEIAKGLVGIGGALLIIAGVSHIVSPIDLLAMGVSLTGVGVALNLIMVAMTGFGLMSWESIAKSLVALAGSLTVLAVASKVIGVDGLVGASAMLVMASALAVMVPSLILLGSMDLDNIGRMLLALVGVFVIFGAAAVLLTPVAPVMLMLGGAIALLGAGVGLLGGGLLALSVALTSFAAAGTAGVVALVLIVESLIGLVPILIQKIGEGLILLLGVIVDAIPLLMDAVRQIVLGIIEVLVDLAPSLIDAVFIFLGHLLDTLLAHVPVLVDTGLQLFKCILEGIQKNIADIVALALEIVAEFLRGVSEGLPDVITSAVDLIVAFLTAIGDELPRVIDAGFKMIIAFINGLADAIRENTPLLVEAMWNLSSAMLEGIASGLFAGITGVKDAIVNVAKALWEGFKNFFGINSPSKLMEEGAGYIISGIIKGLAGGVASLADKAKEIGSAIYNGIKGAVSDVGSVAANVVDTLGKGLKDGISNVTNAAKNLGSNIVNGVKGALQIQSPAKTMIEAAHYTGEGLIIGLRDMGSAVKQAAGDVGEGAIDGMKDSLSRIADVMDADMELAPTIRPVIDLSNVEQGLAHTFAREQSLHVGDIKGKTASIAALHQNRSGSSDGSTSNTTTDNSEQKIEITNHNYVRSNSDISKINRGLDNVMDKYNRTRGVPVRV